MAAGPLLMLLESFRNDAVTEREKGTYFEELYADRAKGTGAHRRGALILIAKTAGTDEYHAIQCNFYAAKQPFIRAF